MIQLDNISKSFGGHTLFSSVSWRLMPGRRIGLIGPNGAGKTTLFRILSGEMEADEGRVVLPAGSSIGLLPQEVGEIGEVPILDYVLSGLQELVDLERSMGALAARIDRAPEEGGDVGKLAQELADAQERFSILGGYSYRSRALEILGGMGFDVHRPERSAAELSGGWKVRLVLSRLLLMRPSVLLMDEPTNHLDIPSVEWLESFLSSYEGTVVIISHDRYFLNRLTNETAALEIDGFYVHSGTYDAYQEAREERLLLLEKSRAQQDRKIKETERFIERFRSKATKAKQVQSRVKQLDKVERIELPSDRKRVARFRFPESARTGRSVCVVRDVAKAFGDVIVYTNANLEIERGEKVALVGPNGAGKSTLLKLMTERLEPDAGSIEIGHNVVPGYFGQHQVDELDASNTILEEMEAYATVETMPLCRSILGAFLFSGDDVKKKISVLSGGERNRVALAKMLLRPSNFLLLDEPTNHLDIESRDVLVRSLAQYGATLVFVSHDRHFINQVANRVVHVEDGRVVSYAGNYEYYSYKRRQEAEEAREQAPTPKPPPRRESGADEGAPPPQKSDNPSNDANASGTEVSESREDRKERKRREAELRNALASRTKGKRKELDTVEANIATLESRCGEIEVALADPALYSSDDGGDEATQLNKELATAKAELNDLYFKWAELSESIERIEAHVRGLHG